MTAPAVATTTLRAQATAVMVAVTPAAVTEAAAMVEEMVVVPAGAMEVAVVGSQQPSGDQAEEANP